MTNAQKFIDLVAKLYDLSEKHIHQMENNIPEIDNEFAGYDWEDIKDKVNLYYARKNDKTRPTIAKIIALLEADERVQKIVPESNKVEVRNVPETKLWTVKQTFNKLVQILIDGGVITDQDGNYRNVRSLINPDTDQVILDPMNWLKQKLAQAKIQKPECFADFQFATPLEQMAIAIQNNLISFKVRDWERAVKQKQQ